MDNKTNKKIRICPKCYKENVLQKLEENLYQCHNCNFELAYPDYATNGMIRGIFGWVCKKGDIIQNRYEILSILGRGGFGTTYLVSDKNLNGRLRALKEIPELMFDKNEILLLSSLKHPSIPDIIDRFTSDGIVYLLLEFGGSRTLSSEQKKFNGKIPIHVLLPWVKQLCEILSYLHSQTPPVIHRDLKPENILLDENDRVILIDFGIAKQSPVSTVTHTLARAATPEFSPPEQVMGTGTDSRSDIYSLGAVLYSLITGKNPSPAHERVAGKELIPPSQLEPSTPLVLEDTILKALDLNMNQRQKSIEEISENLDNISETNAAKTMSIDSFNAHGKIIPSIKISETAKKAKPIYPKLVAVVLIIILAVGMSSGAYYFWPGSPDKKMIIETSETNTSEKDKKLSGGDTLINVTKERIDDISTVLEPQNSSTETVTHTTSSDGQHVSQKQTSAMDSFTKERSINKGNDITLPYVLEEEPETPEDNSSNDRVAEQRKAEQRKAEQRKAEQRKAEQRKAEQRKAEQRKAEQRKAEQRKAEQRKAEQRKAEQRKAEQRKAKQRKAEQRKAEQRKAKQRKAEIPKNRFTITRDDANKIY